MNILSSHTPRERGLILAAILLLGVFAVWQFGIRPVLAQKTAAMQNQQMALRDLDIVQRGLPSLSSAPQSAKAPFDRAAVISEARNANVAISRVQPAPDDGLQVWFEDTEAPNIYRMLSQLTSQYNVTIVRVQMTRRDTGRVSAQVTLAPR